MKAENNFHSELHFIGEKVAAYFKSNKKKSIFFYIIFLIYFSIPSFNIPYIEYNRFRITSLMEQRAIESYLLFYPRQSWRSVNDVNPNLIKGIISIEDGSFFLHKGVDWKEMSASLKTNRRRKKTARGGSTITMQLSKNLFFTTKKSFVRKAKEILVTFRMEKEVSKKNIVEAYINAVEWGDGIFGIGAASQKYFEKDADEINLNESSRLAAVIPSPLRFAPNKNSNYVLRRSSIIRARLNDVILFPENEKKKNTRTNRRR